MTDEPVLDEEAGSNLFEQMRDLFFDDKMEEEGISIDELWAAQVIFISPFKRGQYSNLAGEDNTTEVRINEDVKAQLIVEYKDGVEIDAGDTVRTTDIARIKQVKGIPDFGEDVGHVSFFRTGPDEFQGEVNFLYNLSYVQPLLEAAKEFIGTASYALENEYWRAFVENAFHASERLMKARVIQHGQPAFNHGAVQASYDMFVSSGNANADLLDVNRRIYNMYRNPGSYVDPGNHGGVDEINFELDVDNAEEMLNVISSHFDTLDATDSS